MPCPADFNGVAHGRDGPASKIVRRVVFSLDLDGHQQLDALSHAGKVEQKLQGWYVRSMTVPPANGESAMTAGPVMLPAESVPDRQGVVACLGRASRDRAWALPRLFRVVCLMGEVTLDLTRVQIGPGLSTIEALVVMGEVRITVPHNLHVECEEGALLGEFKVRRTTDAIPSPDAPTVCIRGTVFMGAVKVRVIDPDVPPNWRDQWRAARAAKQLAKAEQRLDRERRRSERDRFSR
jgi:Cell wall-active antibiotics response 4TMS YvqF